MCDKKGPKRWGRHNWKDLSLILSRVLDDLGVNEECVLRRRRAFLMMESLYSVSGNTSVTCHIFGSQTEGTTTDGLMSDLDIVTVGDTFNIIEDWKDWVYGRTNVLMIQDNERFPGHCKLQRLRSDSPEPEDRFIYGNTKIDEDGRLVFTHGQIELIVRGTVRHGPAVTRLGKGRFCDMDIVLAYRCETWPKNFKQWPPCPRRSWPTQQMVEYIMSSGCFVVPTGHRLDRRSDDVWRISTSLAERCLMFNLNITQIRCYVVLKMIVKTYIEPYVPDVISSYICKNLLFHCLERTSRDYWKDSNLLECVNQVLLYMLAAVHSMDCPNYFNESANLLLGKLCNANRRELLYRIGLVLKTRGRFLINIQIDNINDKLTKYITDRSLQLSFDRRELVLTYKSATFVKEVCRRIVNSVIQTLLLACTDKKYAQNILSRILAYSRKGFLQSKSAGLVYPFVCSYFACVESSGCIHHGQDLSPTALQLFKTSLHSDVTSSRLKYASYLYCSGQFDQTMSILQDIEERLTDSVMPICGCSVHTINLIKNSFAAEERKRKYPSTANVALCVMFTRSESACCPQELQFEYFRSTPEERQQRDDSEYLWMDLAVIDSIPYLYFLQFMTLRRLGLQDGQTRALDKLKHCISTDPYIGHIETVYNVLGQCMEYKNEFQTALHCYRRSVQARPIHNAARWHFARLAFQMNQLCCE